MNYSQILNHTLNLYFEGYYQQAYEFVTEASKKTICNDAQIYNFRYSMACVMGKPKLGLELLVEAVKEKGYWYNYDYLMSDDDLEILHNEDAFKEVAELCKVRESSNSEKEMMITDHLNSSNKKVFVALHGNQENAEISKAMWGLSALKAYSKFYPQSSIEEFSTGYTWDDVKKGSKETTELLLKHDKYVENSDLTLAGFSAGCGVALQMVVEQRIKVNQLFLLAPWLPNLEEIKNQLGVIKEKQIKVVLACGDQDEDCYDDAKKLSKYLADADIEHEFYVLEQLQHEYPDNLNELLVAAIEYYK